MLLLRHRPPVAAGPSPPGAVGVLFLLPQGRKDASYTKHQVPRRSSKSLGSTSSMTLLYNHVTETGKTDGTKPPSTSMNGCVKAALEIAKYTTDKTTRMPERVPNETPRPTRTTSWTDEYHDDRCSPSTPSDGQVPLQMYDYTVLRQVPRCPEPSDHQVSLSPTSSTTVAKTRPSRPDQQVSR